MVNSNEQKTAIRLLSNFVNNYKGTPTSTEYEHESYSLEEWSEERMTSLAICNDTLELAVNEFVKILGMKTADKCGYFLEFTSDKFKERMCVWLGFYLMLVNDRGYTLSNTRTGVAMVKAYNKSIKKADAYLSDPRLNNPIEEYKF